MTEGSPFGEHAATVELLWDSPRQPARGPKPGLTVAGIVRAAIAVADADGLGAVTMARVAGELGFTKMSLYRYVPGKAELVALMIDTAVGEPPVLDGGPGRWRARLEAWGLELLVVFGRHPWLLGATVGPRIMGPHELGWTECALAALDGTDLAGGERFDAVAVIAGHIRTIAQRSGTSAHPEQDFGRTLAALLQLHGARYPALTAALTSAMTGGGQDDALDFGLQRILDGLEMLVAARS